MRREFRRGQLSRITVWAGEEGPLPLEEGSVGVEYRGRIGHPSSYGLLAGRLRASDASMVIDLQGVPDEVVVSPPISGDRLIAAQAEPEYESAIRRAGSDLGLQVTVMLAAEISSSQVVFLRLANVLHAILESRDIELTDDQFWRYWDSAARSA